MKAERYPLARATLERLLRAAPAGRAPAPLTGFAIGPTVLRAPREPSRIDTPGPSIDAPTEPDTDGMLGELVDMVFVSADDEAASGRHEVHLVFKAEVLGGLHLKLVRQPDGMHATFVVEDAAARRSVAAHIDDLVRHLRERGFTIAHHAIELASP